MPKSAAAVAQEISDKKTKNKAKPEDTEIVVPEGGIKVDEKTPDKEFSTGTPFDLVEGRHMVDFYGPLVEYGFVTTPHGEYGIPYGKILRLTPKLVYDRKEGTEVTKMIASYEDAPQKLIDYITPVEVS